MASSRKFTQAYCMYFGVFGISDTGEKDLGGWHVVPSRLLQYSFTNGEASCIYLEDVVEL